MEMGRLHRRVRFASFEMDGVAGELCKDGVRIRLQDQPFQILQILLERPGDVIAREELRKRVWPSDTFVDFDHGINNAINRLREALGDTAETPRFIETIPRRGYRFLATLDSKDERIPSLVVLPLENLSGDPEQEYFADGMTEALITSLAKISALRVVSRTTAMHYQGTRQPLPVIARELGVEMVVEGTVLRSGERVRISVQLIEARTDTHLWAESYERDLRDILALQAELARAIANEIQIKLTPAEQIQLARVPEMDPDLYEVYLRGLFQFNKRTAEGLSKSASFFQQAIERDPNYAAAHAGLAHSVGRLGFWGLVTPLEGCGRAKIAARRAIALDDTLSDAHAALSFALLHHDFAFAAAGEEGRRATTLDPRNPGAAQVRACCLITMGRLEEGVAEMLRSVQLDPLSLAHRWTAGILIYHARQNEHAIAQCRKAIELDPTFPPVHWTISFALLAENNYQGAIEEMEGAVQTSKRSPFYLGSLGYIYGRAGREEQARAVIRELEEIATRQYVSPYWIGLVYMSLDDRDTAFRYLELAREQHAPWLAYMKVSPWFDSVRDDPRFDDLLRCMNFP
jgi:TolB-like protein/Flp pilus assembly protein TadD